MRHKVKPAPLSDIETNGSTVEDVQSLISNLSSIPEDDLLKLAAAHVDDAEKGRGSYGKAYSMQQSTLIQQVFLIIDSTYWYYIMLSAVILHCGLLFFDNYEKKWHKDKDLKHIAPMVVEALCLIFYIIDIVLIIIYYTPKLISDENEDTLFSRMKEIPVQLMQLFFTILFCFDFIYFHALVYSENYDTKRIFVCFRAFQLLVKKKTVLHIFWVTVKTVIGLLSVLVGILAYVMFFACIAVHLFAEIYHKQVAIPGMEGPSDTSTPSIPISQKYEDQFDQVFKAFMRLFVLLTTENYPDIMIPAYKDSKWTFIFFCLFLFIGVFIITSILLAIVVENYWKLAKAEKKRERLKNRKELTKAWKIIDRDGIGELALNCEMLVGVLKRVRPNNNPNEIEILLQELAKGGTMVNRVTIDNKSWVTRLPDVLLIEFEHQTPDTSTLLNDIKKPGGKLRIYLISIMQSSIISRIVIVLLYIHATCFLIYNYQSALLELTVQCIRATITFVFIIESIARMLGLGVQYLTKADYIDILLVALGSLVNILWFYFHFKNSEGSFYTEKGLCVVVSSIAFMARLAVNSAQVKTLVQLIMQIIPVMADLTILVLIIIFFFSAFGETIFDTIEPEQLSEKLDIGDYSYIDMDENCGIGFNNFLCSFITVFQIITTSNWHEIMQATIEVEGSPLYSIYFIISYIIMNMIIINLFVAIAYEAYNKFVSKPKKASTMKGKSIKHKIGHYLNRFTTGNRRNNLIKRISPDASAVTIKRKSLSLLRQKDSNSSFGDDIPLALQTGKGDSESEEDLSGLPLEKRQQILMKRRMEKKAREKGKVRRHPMRSSSPGPITFADVVEQYSAQNDTELTLTPGQRVKVLEKLGSKVKGSVVEGPNAGKIGWFPAFVVTNIVSDMSRNITPRNSVSTDSDTSKIKIVKKQTSDWTKDIIGPMTIMNPNELKELNKILKANSRQHRSNSEASQLLAAKPKQDNKNRAVSLSSGPFKPQPSKRLTTPKFEMNIVEEEEEEEEEEEKDEVFEETKKYTDEMLPLVVIEHPSVIENESDGEMKEVQIDGDKLSSPISSSPELKNKINRAKNKLKDKKKDMPEWARKLLENQENDKIADSSSIKSPDNEASVDPLSLVVEHMSKDEDNVIIENPEFDKIVVKSPECSEGITTVQNKENKSATKELFIEDHEDMLNNTESNKEVIESSKEEVGNSKEVKVPIPDKGCDMILVIESESDV